MAESALPWSAREKMESVRAAILDSQPPYCAGTLALEPEDLLIFYGKDDPKTHGRIDFNHATDEQLQRLAEACDKATFGRNDEDVFDESYRKAGKLDASQFCDRVDLERSGLIDTVRYNLLKGPASSKPIRTESYKLNVYGKDSFFKSHKDTPRSSEMFGSLVIIFPTPHEGGALILRHHSKEWTFDSGKEIGNTKNIGYVAFFSDVEHEVTPVKSGYRVTLSYNLYFDEAPILKPTLTLPLNESAVKNALRALVEDETFHPEGVHLAFGLCHEYSIATKPEKVDTVEFISRNLKGSDAVLKEACEELSLKSRLFLCYSAVKDGFIYDVLIPKVSVFADGSSFLERGENFATWLVYSEDEQWFVRRYKNEPVSEGSDEDGSEDSGSEHIEKKSIIQSESDDQDTLEDAEDSEYIDFPITWVTGRTPYNIQKAWWVTPGKDYGSYTTGHSFGKFCLLVSLGPAGKRGAGLPMKQKAKEFHKSRLLP